MGDFSEFRRDVLFFLTSLRHTLDRPFRMRPLPVNEDRERFTKTMLLIEEARIRFNTYSRYRGDPKPEEWGVIKGELLSFINTFMHTRELGSSYDLKFRFFPPHRERENPTPFSRDLAGIDALPVSVAVLAFRSMLEATDFSAMPIQENLSFNSLDKIVPKQQVAPVQFEIVDGQIRVANRSPKTHAEDRENIASALEHIRGNGENLMQNLENSNCDRRLLESVRELQAQLISDGNIIKIGLTNMGCGVMCSQFQADMPDAISAMFHSYSSAVSMYVNQFPEWEQFIQKASQTELDDHDIAEVDEAAGEIIEVLSAGNNIASPEVPKTIEFIRQFLSYPGASAKRAAYAMIRTIENLVAGILHHALDCLNKTADKTVQGFSTVASAVIIGLLTVALTGAVNIGAAASRAGVPWVSQAADIVQRQIEKLKE